MNDNVKYYVELVRGGQRVPATWLQAEQLVRLFGWRYILRTDTVEVIGK